MFWNKGNWQRTRLAKNPLPEHLEKYRKHINFDFDSEHRLVGDRLMYNNFCVNVVKNLKTHLFMNFETGSIFKHRKRIEEGGYTVCFNDYHDLVAARIGKDGYVKQIAGYDTDPNDPRPRVISWAIFEIVWGTTINRQSKEEEPLTRARMQMHRVCVYHVGQEHIGRAAALCGEIIATTCWECMHFQVDVMAGDGNKAAYLSTPK